MNARRITFALLLAALAAGYFLGRSSGPETAPPAAPAADAAEHAGHGSGGGRAEPDGEAEAELWTCSMHPQIKLPRPGRCPICGMALVPVETRAETHPRRLTMTEEAARLADIETSPVLRRPVAKEVRMVGKVAYDETRLGVIAAWTGGRIEKLYVDYMGAAVRKGQPLAELYSPELVSAQAELIEAVRAAREMGPEGDSLLRRMSGETADAARTKLRLLGLKPDQIAAIEKRGEASERITVRAPAAGVVTERMAVEGMYVSAGEALFKVADLSRVWVMLAAYETDLAWLRVGQTATFVAANLPGERFEGRIAFIDPVLDPMSRTARVRVEAENREGRLKPETFVDAVVKTGRLESDEAPLTIPATAPLLTGERAVVYVRVPDAATPTFEGRVVALGPRAGDAYIVREGLREGEEVVTRGAFRIDSDLQIRARPSMMTPEGGVPAPAHRH